MSIHRIQSRHYLAMAALGGAALVGTACTIDIDSGEKVTETFTITEFERLEIDGAFDVEIEIGPEPSLEIDVHEEVADRLEVENDGDTLRIGFDGGLFSVSGGQDVRITTPSLSALDLNGAVSADITDLDADRLEIDLDGATDLEATGSASEVIIDIDGASNVDFDDLTIGRVEVQADGASSIDVSEAEEVRGELKGASSLNVSDDANVNVRTSGASSIN